MGMIPEVKSGSPSNICTRHNAQILAQIFMLKYLKTFSIAIIGFFNEFRGRLQLRWSWTGDLFGIQVAFIIFSLLMSLKQYSGATIRETYHEAHLER